MFVVIWKSPAGVECWSDFVDFVTAVMIQAHLEFGEVASEILVATKSFRDKIAATQKVLHPATNALLLPVKASQLRPLPQHVVTYSKAQ